LQEGFLRGCVCVLVVEVFCGVLHVGRLQHGVMRAAFRVHVCTTNGQPPFCWQGGCASGGRSATVLLFARLHVARGG